MVNPAVSRAAIHPPEESQRAASDPVSSVWVNASAGSGKTTILTARVTRLLLAGVPPEKILCLTYTRAGAAEMTNRITEKFSKWVSCDDDTLYRELDELQKRPPDKNQARNARRLFARVLSCPGGLRIRTIHSFCQEILLRFPIEAGLPPHFGLIDEQELDVLKDQILDDLLREASVNPDTEFARALSVLIADRGEYGFTAMLKESLRQCGKLPDDIAGLMAKTCNLLGLEPGDTVEKFRQNAMEKIPVETMRHMAAWLADGTDSHKKRGLILAEIVDLPSAQRVARFEDYYRLFLKSDLEPYAESSVADKKTRTQHPEILTIAAREATRLISVLERCEAAIVAKVTESVLLFGHAMAQRLTAAKAARAALDYDDLVLYTERLLSRDGISSWILHKLDNGIDHILVDEAQDTSRAQWTIVQALAAEFYAGQSARTNVERTLFVVGDEKQSIFSFQNADPESFSAFRDFFAGKLADGGKHLEQIPLHTSFRSSPVILSAVDKIFSEDAARKGVSSNPITHQAHKTGMAGAVELWELVKPVKDKTEKDGAWIVPTEHEEEHDPQAELASLIARKIATLIAHKQATAGDIMILLRRRGRFADLMVRALKAARIPVTGLDRMHLIDQLPVMDLLAAVRFVLLPEDDLNLAALLRSPLLGLSEEQLMDVSAQRTTSLWQRLKDTPACAAAHDYLAARLNEADFSTPFVFLSHILNTPCPANAVSGRMALWSRLGEEALDPIEELLNAAHHFSQGHAPSLQNFLHWLVRADAEIKRELDRSEGRVRIMTVHASKGLEAPVVFLPDTTAVPRTTDIPRFQWAPDGSPLFLSREPDFSAPLRQVWQQARDKQMEEYRRLFYVALTRAANRLYICGWQSRNGESGRDEGSWYALAETVLPVVAANPETAPPNAVRPSGDTMDALSLPQWALRPVPVLPQQWHMAQMPLPDDNVASPDTAFARGRIIHRLLQSLPEIKPENRVAAVERFLSQPKHELAEAQRKEIAQEVGRLLADERFSVLFSSASRAEVGLTGTINGAAVFRQIDRLCLQNNEVWIVDYKTNRPPPENPSDVPAAYREQLNEYRLLLRGIYPDKRVRCFLLWTYAPRLMEI